MVLLALALAYSSQPMVAFTAYRGWKDGPIGHSQVYVCDLDGKHRKAVTRERKNCEGVRWMGDHILCYMVGDSMVKRLDLWTHRSKVILRFNDTEITDDHVRIHRGRSVYPRYLAHGFEYEIPLSGPRRIGKEKSNLPDHLPLTTPFGVVMEEGHKVVLRAKLLRLVIADDPLGMPPKGAFVGAWTHDGGLNYIHYTGTAATGDNYTLETFRGSKSRTICSGRELDADLDRKWLATVETGYPQYVTGRGKYWIAGVVVKDWKRGQEFKVSHGLACASSVSLNPDAR